MYIAAIRAAMGLSATTSDKACAAFRFTSPRPSIAGPGSMHFVLLAATRKHALRPDAAGASPALRGNYEAAQKVTCHPERSEGSRMVTLGVLFTGSFVPSFLRMTRWFSFFSTPHRRGEPLRLSKRRLAGAHAPFRFPFSVIQIFTCKIRHIVITYTQQRTMQTGGRKYEMSALRSRDVSG